MLKIRAAIAVGIAIAVLMTGCSSTPTAEQTAATVEDRKPINPPSVRITPPVAVAPQPATPARIDPPAQLGSAALRDPNSILSKRIIYFEFDSNLVKEEFRPLVSAHAKYISQDRNARMIIQGNTDERGSREYNLALGQRRADAVKQMMTVLGAEGTRVESVSFGEEKPRAEGANEAAWAQNRRAEIVYQGE